MPGCSAWARGILLSMSSVRMPVWPASTARIRMGQWPGLLGLWNVLEGRGSGRALAASALDQSCGDVDGLDVALGTSEPVEGESCCSLAEFDGIVGHHGESC